MDAYAAARVYLKPSAQMAGRASVELHTLIFFRGREVVADARITKARPRALSAARAGCPCGLRVAQHRCSRPVRLATSICALLHAQQALLWRVRNMLSGMPVAGTGHWH
jgi:hypothetical protein